MKNSKFKIQNGGLRLLAAGFAFCIFNFALTGCSMVSGTRHPDGRLVVTSWRLLWKSEAISFATGDSNFSAALRIGKSATDDEALALATQAAVAAAMKGVIPLLVFGVWCLVFGT